MPTTNRPFSAEELGLLDAIHAEPRSDELRLVYADCLEDSGRSELAELTRLGVVTSKSREADPTQLARIGELEKRLRRRYASPLPKGAEFSRWERGLPWFHPRRSVISAATVGQLADDFAPRMSKLYSLFALLAYDSTAELAQVLTHPFLEQVHRLCFIRRRGDTTIEDAEVIAGSQQFARLESINVRSVTPDQEDEIRAAMTRNHEIQIRA